MRTLLLAAVLFSGCATAAHPPVKAVALDSKVLDVGDFDGTLEPVQAKFDELVAAGKKTITFRIDSYGGSVERGLDFIKHIEDAKKAHGVATQCVVDDRAFSMGFVFLQSNACDERYMTKRSRLLAHEASTQVKGNLHDILSEVGLLKATNQAIAAIASARLFISPAEYDAKVAAGDWSLGWKDAADVGAVDGFVNPADLPPPYELPVAADPLQELLKKMAGG